MRAQEFITEGQEKKPVTIYTNPANKGATVDDSIKKSLPVQQISFDKLQQWENHKTMQDPRVADWVNNKLLPELQQNGTLDPLSVWNDNGELFVIDGNHRFVAYQQAGYRGRVPVQIVPDNMITIVDTVMSKQAIAENKAAGINKMFNNLGDPVYANLQRVALLAMQGRQSEAAGRLQTVIKDADPAVQKKITDAVNNIKPVTINGRVADSSTLDKSKQHNDWITNTFIPWVQSLLGQQGVAEARKNPEQNTKYQSGWAELAAWARKNNVWLKPHEWAISMTYVPKLGINPGPGISEDTPRGIYFYPFQWAYSVKMDKEALPWADNAPYIQLFQYSTGTELYDPNQIPLASAVAQLKNYGITDEDIAAEKENYPGISTYNLLVWCLGRKYDDNKRVTILNKVLRNLGYDYMIDNGKGWIAINEPTQGVVLNPKIIDKVVTFNNYTRKKEQGVAEGSLNESAVFLNPNTVVVGQEHGQPLELSPDTLKKVQAIAAKHGAYYEGNGTDRAYTKGQIDRYVGSWDDEVAKTASPNDPKWLYVLFANVDENNRVQRVGVDPKDTIFNRLLAGAQDNSFQGIGYTAQALQKFLQMASEGKYDFVKMSQQPATQENLTRFLKAGEALMWPSNWEQYPNRAGKIAKAATVDVRDQYLATRKAGVYVTGSGHLKAVQNITGKQDVAENFADGKNPVKFTVTTPDGYTHSFQITLAVHGKHVGHFNFVRSADTDDVNNEAEVESRWQGQGYGKLLLMKAIDVANNHGLDFQQDIRGITDAQQNVYDSLENAGLIVTPGDGFWFLTPQGEQELNGLNENFADGKNPGRKGLAKRSGVNTKASVSSLRKTAKNSSGEKQRMAHWLANMKAGRAKAKRK